MSTTPVNTLEKIEEKSVAQSFIARIEKEFKLAVGQATGWTDVEKKLGQHLYLKIDESLRVLNSKKAKDALPITWDNVNMSKLAIDAASRVSLKLDAMLKNHIHVVPYLNSKTNKYDVDLRIGYIGNDHLARKYAIDPPLEITYGFVHEGDDFRVARNDKGGDMPQHIVKDYFKPGEVIGGFGFIRYDDPRKDRVVIVEFREFEKAEIASRGVEFWGGNQTKWVDGKKVQAGYDEKFRKEMQWKTVIHRVCAKIPLDSEKINASAMQSILSSSLDMADLAIESEIASEANAKVINLNPETGEVTDAEFTEETPEEKQEEAPY